MGKPLQPLGKKMNPLVATELDPAALGRFRDVIEESGFSGADVLRMCVDAALPSVRFHLAALKDPNIVPVPPAPPIPIIVTLKMTGAELSDLRSLYRSGVTDCLPRGIETLEGAEFVDAAEKSLAELELKLQAKSLPTDCVEQSRRFLRVYAQIA